MAKDDDDKIEDPTTEEILAKIRKDKRRLEGKFDDNITYRQLVEEDICVLMGFTTLSEERQRKFREMVGQMLETRVAIKILDSLNEQDRATYIDMLQSGEHEIGYNFLVEKGIDPLEIMTIESVMLKTELYLDSKTVKAAAQEKFDQQYNNKGGDAA